jgi:hypothetical protein
MNITISQDKNAQNMEGFIKYICEQVVSAQSVKRPDKGHILVDYDVQFIIKRANKACSRRVQGCGAKKYHSKNKVMAGRTRG